MPDAVLVAGGTGALGSAVVEELLRAGRPVTATWVVEAERDRLGERDGLELVKADLFDPDAARDVVDGVAGLGAVVNLVGGYSAGGKVHETGVEVLEQMLRLNLRPSYLLAGAAMPRLSETGGAFVGVAARAALRPFAGAAAYIASKAALIAFIQALDAEYGPKVRCNALVPSIIDTPANRANEPHADHSKWTKPEQIAQVVRFLVSDESAAVCGAAVPV